MPAFCRFRTSFQVVDIGRVRVMREEVAGLQVSYVAVNQDLRSLPTLGF